MKRLTELSPNPRTAKIAWGIVVGLLFLLQLYQNASNIGHKPIWLDEGSTFLVASKNFFGVINLASEFQSQPPLYYLSIHFLLKISSSEWFLRGFSWVCGTGLLAFVLFALEELGLFARVAFCILYIFGPIAHYLCQEMRAYSMAASFNLLSIVFFMRLVREPTRARMKWYIALTFIALHSHAFDIWSFTAQGLATVGIFLWELRGGKIREAFQRRRELILAIGITGILYIPYFLLVTYWQSDAVHRQTSFAAAFQEATRWDHVEQMLRAFNPLGAPWNVAVFGLALGALLSGLFFGGREVLILGAAVVFHIACVHGFLFQRSFMAERYFTPIWPVFLLLITVGIDGVARMVDRRAWIAVVVALWWWVGDARPAWTAYRQAPLPFVGWRAVAQRLREQPGKKVIFFQVGYEGQILEYEVRNDPDVELRLNKKRGWSSGGEGMTDAYIKSSLQETESSARCYYYQPGDGAVFSASFVPEMARLGMQPVSSPGEGLRGYCK